MATLSMRLLRCWARYELPKKRALLRRAGVWDDRLWTREPARTCRGAWHGYRMRLEISDVHQRGAYLFGRMMDVAVPLCLLGALRRGETCIDVGANIGMTAMLASRAVGGAGRVLAFEPNPEVYRRLLWHIGENRLAQVRPFNCALSDAEGAMRLSVPADNCGAATLGSVPARLKGHIAATHEVPVRIGDSLVGELPPAPLLIKMDVEGHETRALRGLSATLARHGPAVLLECNIEMLPHNGSSPAGLLSLMHGLGYDAYHVGARWHRLARRWRLVLHLIPPGHRPRRTINVLFLKPGGVHESRLAGCIAPPSPPLQRGLVTPTHSAQPSSSERPCPTAAATEVAGHEPPASAGVAGLWRTDGG